MMVYTLDPSLTLLSYGKKAQLISFKVLIALYLVAGCLHICVNNSWGQASVKYTWAALYVHLPCSAKSDSISFMLWIKLNDKEHIKGEKKTRISLTFIPYGHLLHR